MGAKTRKLSQINDSLIEWQSVVVADGSTGLTAVAGRGYFINTTAGAITVTLPSATAKPGDVIQLKDYARTWGTNAVTLASNTFDGGAAAPSFSTNGKTVTLVYMDNTQGWSLINEDTTTGLAIAYTSATGGTVTTSGNFKIHTFTGDGCFVVSTVGNPAGGGDNVDYFVVAGGGGAGGEMGGGGGGGGFRLSNSTSMPAPTTSPLASPTGITITSTTYPVTVGGGGSGGFPAPQAGTKGSDSVFSTITSTGGGLGAASSSPGDGGPGGSGGGGGGTPSGGAAGSGNTPPTSPPQGNNAGTAAGGGSSEAGGGGGGAGGTGVNAVSASSGGNGGIGSYADGPSFAGANGEAGPVPGARYFSGGGGGGGASNVGTAGTGGIGGAGNGLVPGTSPTSPQPGDANTGGGGGGQRAGSSAGGNGGKGIVIIRYQFQ